MKKIISIFALSALMTLSIAVFSKTNSQQIENNPQILTGTHAQRLSYAPFSLKKMALWCESDTYQNFQWNGTSWKQVFNSGTPTSTSTPLATPTPNGTEVVEEVNPSNPALTYPTNMQFIWNSSDGGQGSIIFPNTNDCEIGGLPGMNLVATDEAEIAGYNQIDFYTDSNADRWYMDGTLFFMPAPATILGPYDIASKTYAYSDATVTPTAIISSAKAVTQIVDPGIAATPVTNIYWGGVLQTINSTPVQ